MMSVATYRTLRQYWASAVQPEHVCVIARLRAIQASKSETVAVRRCCRGVSQSAKKQVVWRGGRAVDGDGPPLGQWRGWGGVPRSCALVTKTRLGPALGKRRTRTGQGGNVAWCILDNTKPN